jgi:acetyl-CoA synthetase
MALADGDRAGFRAARAFLLDHRTDYSAALGGYRWPHPQHFNWALDWFDVEAADPATGQRTALWISEEDGREAKFSFADMSRRSSQVANWLRSHGVRRGDRLLLMLGNQVELWDTLLAAMKLDAVVIPASTLLSRADIADRLERGGVAHIVARTADAERFGPQAGALTRFAVGAPVEDWRSFSDAYTKSANFEPEAPTRSSDPLLLYFTSGTTARPKLVGHTHASYPIGHLSTMYWIGLEPGDVHLNISSPGWAKHAWSNFFAPWNAGATVFIYNYSRFDADALMANMQRCGVTSFCAPPTVWRMLIQADLTKLSRPPTKIVSAGEPLNPEVIEQVERAWGVAPRDGFGQTETSVLVANTPGSKVKAGSMGRPLPGFEIVLLDPVTGTPANEGEICVALQPGPVGLMTGYQGDDERTSEVMRDGYYHTGDVGRQDDEGYIYYVGRIDDVFKSSDYRVSPFELESVLLEHEAVAEAAVVPSPDPLRLAVPKAYVVLAAAFEPSAETARAIFDYSRTHLAAYKRIRRIEFAELPKTISGKIRRTELRSRELEIHADPSASVPGEYRE